MAARKELSGLEVLNSLTLDGHAVWHAGNDGSGSGLDADLLDGSHASAFARLTGATFTGTINAPTVRVGGVDVWHPDNDGSGTGLDADLLDGNHASAFAKLDGAVFTGGVTAAGFTGPGGGLTGLNGSQVTTGSVANARLASMTAGTVKGRALGSNGTPVDLTAAQLLAIISTVDGPGSGLDADTLDGDQAAAFAKLTGAVFTGGVTATGFTGPGGGLTGVNAATLGGQSPSAYALLSGATFTGVVTVPHLATTSATGGGQDGAGDFEDGLYVEDAQPWTGVPSGFSFGPAFTAKRNDNRGVTLLAQPNTTSPEFWLRAIHTSNFSPWARLWTDRNHGPSSGLNADLLDGNHASAFAQLSGATFTGAVQAASLAATGGITAGAQLEVSNSNYGQHLKLTRRTESWQLDPSTDGSLDLRRITGTGTARLDLTADLTVTGDTLLQGLGVGGASPDATNKFAFYGTNMLFNSGGSIDATFNKNAAGNDASFSFKTGFSARALLGLLGDDNFTLKVGSGFHTALVADHTNGKVTFPNTVLPARQAYGITGRWYMNTDNRWVTFPAAYGAATENYNQSGGTGTEPAVNWTFIGPFVRAGAVIHEVKGMLRASNVMVTGMDVRVIFQTGNLASGGWDTNAETSQNLLFSGNNLSFTDTNWLLCEWSCGDFVAPQDGVILVFIRPVGTVTAIQYLYGPLSLEYTLAGS